MNHRQDFDEQKEKRSRERIEYHKQNRLRQLRNLMDDESLFPKVEGVTRREVSDALRNTHPAAKPSDDFEYRARANSFKNPAQPDRRSDFTAEEHSQTTEEYSHRQRPNRHEGRLHKGSGEAASGEPSNEVQEQEERLREQRLNDPTNTFYREYRSRNELGEEAMRSEYATRQTRFEADCLHIAGRRREREEQRQTQPGHGLMGEADEYATRQARWEAECREIARMRQERIVREERERQVRGVAYEVERRQVMPATEGTRSREKSVRRPSSTSRGPERRPAVRPPSASDVSEPPGRSYTAEPAPDGHERDGLKSQHGKKRRGRQLAVRFADRVEAHGEPEPSRKSRESIGGRYYDDDDDGARNARRQGGQGRNLGGGEDSSKDDRGKKERRRWSLFA